MIFRISSILIILFHLSCTETSVFAQNSDCIKHKEGYLFSIISKTNIENKMHSSTVHSDFFILDEIIDTVILKTLVEKGVINDSYGYVLTSAQKGFDHSGLNARRNEFFISYLDSLNTTSPLIVVGNVEIRVIKVLAFYEQSLIPFEEYYNKKRTSVSASYFNLNKDNLNKKVISIMPFYISSIPD